MLDLRGSVTKLLAFVSERQEENCRPRRVHDHEQDGQPFTEASQGSNVTFARIPHAEVLGPSADVIQDDRRQSRMDREVGRKASLVI